MWMYDSTGIYTVKSGYRAIKEWKTQATATPSTSNNINPIWKKVQSLHTIPRHKSLLWRVLNNSLPVRNELSKRGNHCTMLCPRCNIKVETNTHVFMSCPNIIRI